MGTRSITTVRHDYQGQIENHAHIYRHWDGYLSGHGDWLYSFLNGLTVGNGKPLDADENFVNGPGRLAARLVSAMQYDGQEPDLMSVYGPCGQEYEYVITVIGYEQIEIEVYTGPMTFFGGGGDECVERMFKGTVGEFGEFLKIENEEES